jgi:hypothetical protein
VRWASATSSTRSTGSTPPTLPARARGSTTGVKARDGRDAARRRPTGEWLGCAPTPIPGWMQVDIPPELYEAVRSCTPRAAPVPGPAVRRAAHRRHGADAGQDRRDEDRRGQDDRRPAGVLHGVHRAMKVHVVTVNDYLVQRDRDWTFPFFHALGLTVGAIHPSTCRTRTRSADVPLRRGLRHDGRVRLRLPARQHEASVGAAGAAKRQFAIVDEVDSILIDEARTPLIISGRPTRTSPGTSWPTSWPGTWSRSRSPGEADEKVERVQEADQGPRGRHPPGPRQGEGPRAAEASSTPPRPSCPRSRPSATSSRSTTR